LICNRGSYLICSRDGTRGSHLSCNRGRSLKLFNCIDVLTKLLNCIDVLWTLLLLQVMHGRELCHFVAMAPASLRVIWLGWCRSWGFGIKINCSYYFQFFLCVFGDDKTSNFGDVKTSNLVTLRR
jgi:hypothetical protein